MLAVHNFYQQPGGEDQVFAAETRLLEAHGVEVVRYTAHNDQLSSLHRLELTRRTLWNAESYRELASLIRERRPHVMHAHNTFPLISPAAYAAARDGGIPVVQTLHNFRLLCANGLLFRDGRVCEDCVGRAVPWPAVVHRCYRGDLAASAVVATMLVYHRAKGTWQHDVDIFIAPTEFARSKLIEGGLPPAKIMVKPNFVERGADAPPLHENGERNYMLYVGRLSPEKGIRTLLAAWKSSAGLLPLRIVGDGPLRDEVLQAATGNPRIEWLGYQPAPQVQQWLGGARALVFPSECYEMFPLVVLEAYSTGLPVIGSRSGALESIIHDGRTGLLFAAANPVSLREKVLWASRNRDSMASMGKNALAVYREQYTGAVNYEILRAVYARAISLHAEDRNNDARPRGALRGDPQ